MSDRLIEQGEFMLSFARKIYEGGTREIAPMLDWWDARGEHQVRVMLWRSNLEKELMMFQAVAEMRAFDAIGCGLMCEAWTVPPELAKERVRADGTHDLGDFDGRADRIEVIFITVTDFTRFITGCWKLKRGKPYGETPGRVRELVPVDGVEPLWVDSGNDGDGITGILADIIRLVKEA